jgi:SAM-dependent methyltransferase
MARVVLPLIYRGEVVQCPCCGRSSREFIRRCAHYLSLQRHRLVLLCLLAETRIESRTLKLHFAPEEGLQETLRQIAGPGYIIRTRISHRSRSIPFDADSFDLIICNHVLEHVVEDRLAMRELYRVLRPGRRALLLQPVHDELPQTIEDPTITSPKERLRAFGQRDHVRMIYGRISRRGWWRQDLT